MNSNLFALKGLSSSLCKGYQSLWASPVLRISLNSKNTWYLISLYLSSYQGLVFLSLWIFRYGQKYQWKSKEHLTAARWFHTFRALCIVQAFSIHEEDSSFKLISSITSQVRHENGNGDEGVFHETSTQAWNFEIIFACFRDQPIDLNVTNHYLFSHWQQCFCLRSSLLHLVSQAFLPCHCRIWRFVPLRKWVLH